METIKKFVIIGPESTGKSTLCSQLAEHYKTLWVPEYAREYLLKKGTDYAYDDLLTIAKGQIDGEEIITNQFADKIEAPGFEKNKHRTSDIVHHKSKKAFLFIDTDMYVMKVWCEYVFNKCHNWILNRIAERDYDGYLLCNADLDWVADALREYPDKTIRQKLYYYYKDVMINQTIPWVDITGNYTERFEKAVKFIDDKI
ncbi:MAG TPA: ATP-binding protein [Chitinophagaceae bacterium]|nr:ATP-binding protein [Chitinophagaceae bacterium]